MRVCPTCYAQEQDAARFCGLCGTPLLEVKSSADQMVGQLVGGKFSIERLIGRGGMGDVYLACDRVLDRKVAIKILNHRFRGDETVIIRFHKEAKSYARVNHANAVVLFDYGQLDDGNVYLVMEYVDGCSLTDYMRRIGGPMPQDVALMLATQLAEALTAAHNQGVVHRDLKPDNIMLTEPTKGRLQVKVLDFGIAKLLDDQSGDQLTQAGMVFGTPEFMSPEQAQGIEVDHRTDIYAFGMILYYMLVDGLPFEGKNKIAILNQQVNDVPPRPSARCPQAQLHPAFEQLVMTCLEKEREDRYPSFEAVLHDLESLRVGDALAFGSDVIIAAPDPDSRSTDSGVVDAPLLPGRAPRAELSGLISLGSVSSVQGSRGQRVEGSGVFSLGSVSSVQGASRGQRAEASGVFSLGSPTPTPPPARSRSDLNRRLDTQSPGWFDGPDGDDAGPSFRGKLDSGEVVLDPLETPNKTPKPGRRDEPSFNTDPPAQAQAGRKEPARKEPALTLGGLDGPGAGDDDEGEGFTLDGPDDNHAHGRYQGRRDGGGAGLIIFLVLLLAGGGAAYWLLMKPATEATPAPAAPDATSPGPADAVSAPGASAAPADAVEPSLDVAAVAPAPDDAVAEALAPTAAPTTAPTAAPSPPQPTKPPPPLPMAFHANMRQRGVARAVLLRATALFDETKFKDADKLLSAEHLTLPSITGQLLDDLTKLRATNQRAQALLSAALGHAQTLQCHLAESEAAELATLSPPAAKTLDPKVKACRRKLEAPPSKIPD